jgi:hypothetical protein
MPIDNHDKDMRHSLYGRRFGIDDRGLIVGTQDIRHGTETVLTTAPSTLAPGGTSLLQATATATYELVPPSASMVGVCKRLVHNSTGAAALLVKLSTAAAAGGNFMSVLGTSANTITLTTRGAYVDLEYITTALVAALLQTTSTSFTALTTTT